MTLLQFGFLESTLAVCLLPDLLAHRYFDDDDSGDGSGDEGEEAA
jgi:hypothetical protein